MIASMTAFGRLQESGDWGQATWEIRTVNHRYLEMSVRLPEELRILENSIRERISKHIKRGKVDCVLRYEANDKAAAGINLNLGLADQLIKAAESLQVSGPTSLNPIDILRWPGVIENETFDPEQISSPVLELLDSTLSIVVETRLREGEKIHAMIDERCDTAFKEIDKIKELLPEIQTAIKERILGRSKELSSELDNDRLEQEILLLAQKMDVAEEIERLIAHIGEVKRVLQEDKPVGRRLDFLMQEMNREANTLGSKSASIDTSNSSVELKVLIEQMREQIQNVE